MEHTEGYCNERIEEWMERQEVSSFESFCNCCDPQKVKRRKARYVLYKQLVLEEIEKRCQKYEDNLLPKEKEAIEEAKEKFSRGNYSYIYVPYSFVGTFYTPSTIILHLIYPGMLFPLLLPMSYLIYWMICRMRMKDKRNACMITSFIICILLILLPCLFIDIFFVLFCFPLIFSIFLLLELAFLAISIIFCYGFYFLSRCGILHYTFRITLIGQESGTVRKKLHEINITHRIRHAPSRRLYSQPICSIFHKMHISTYDFGEINGQLVTQDGINSYNRYYR